MWCLPSISLLNQRAADNAPELYRQQRDLTDGDGQSLKCGRCEKAQASHAILYFDVFSDDPKGLVPLCEGCEVGDDLFYCDDCGRYLVTNYTYELYGVASDDGIFCLNCHAKRVLANDDNWIPLTDEAIDEFGFDDLRQAKHLQAVGQETPEGLTCVLTVEVDSARGGRLTSCSTCEESPDGAVEEVRSTLRELQNAGVPRAIVIVSAAYQFAVTLSVCVDRKFAAQGKEVGCGA